MLNRTIGSSGLVLLLLLALAAMGIGVALWSKVLTIEGIIQTGSVNAAFVEVFTDDDDAVDNAQLDSQDTGDCPISVGPTNPPPGFPDKNEGNSTSCDPAETGKDPKRHYDKDVARCDARAVPDGEDEEPQPGSQLAQMVIQNAYPSYHCTAWFRIVNNGTIPIHLHSVKVQGLPAKPCQLGSTPYDLNGDTRPDVEICISGLPNCTSAECPEPQIHPREEFFLDVDVHVMQTAPQAATMSFTAEVCLHQWNEETGNCPEVAIP